MSETKQTAVSGKKVKRLTSNYFLIFLLFSPSHDGMPEFSHFLLLFPRSQQRKSGSGYLFNSHLIQVQYPPMQKKTGGVQSGTNLPFSSTLGHISLSNNKIVIQLTFNTFTISSPPSPLLCHNPISILSKIQPPKL